jgi:uncharacterized surface protein with fasciclin (FAS1) repeats
MKHKKIFIYVLTVCLFMGASNAALAKKNKDKDKPDTILQTLKHTDGSQALLAAMTFVDEAGDCRIQIEQLLDNKKEKLVFFAPSNDGFAKFLKLPEGGFDGMDTDAIVLAFPGLLNKIEPVNLCDVLLNHVAPTKDAKKMTAKRLLQQGSITVEDGALFPIAVGKVGPKISYAGGSITERDVFTVNGVIHYIDNVIVEPEPEPPEGPSPSDICTTVDTCAVSGPSRNDCQTFVLACGAAGQDTADCAQGAALICFETELGGL